MSLSALLHLSVDDSITDHRLAERCYRGEVTLLDKRVRIAVSQSALEAARTSARPVLAQLELYFSCLVRKQVRFCELENAEPRTPAIASATAQLFTGFRALTTRHRRMADAGREPPAETVPLSKPERFLPDWIRIDFRDGMWLGDYGYECKR